MTRAEAKELKRETKYKSLVAQIGVHHFPGKGGREKAREFLTRYLGTSCPYCGKIIDEFNLIVEHYLPKSKTNNYTAEQLEILNSPENQIASCDICNKAKGDLDGDEYKLLIKHLRDWEADVLLLNRHELSPKKGSVNYVLTKLKASGYRYYRK